MADSETKDTQSTADEAPKSTKASKTAATKSAAVKKTTARKTAAKKPAAQKTTAKKSASAKTPKPVTARKTSAKKTATRKPTASKSAPQAEAQSEKQAQDATSEESSMSDKEFTAATDEAEKFFDELKGRDWSSLIQHGVFLIVFGFLGWWAMHAILILATINFVISLLQGERVDTLSNLTSRLGNYIADIAAYLGQESKQRPFPLGKDFPEA